MDMDIVDQYYLPVGEGLDKNIVVGGPIYSANGSEEEIGKIIDYIPETGFARLKLYMDVSAHELIRAGIPVEHIVFKNEA